MTDPTRPPAADPARPEAGQAIHHAQKDTSQRKDAKHFPHGFPANTAAWQIHHLFNAIDVVNDGRLARNGHDLFPLISAGQSLSLALANALEVADLKGIDLKDIET